MYPPKHFQEHNSEQLQSLVNQFPLATIFMPSLQNALNDICHTPLLFDAHRNMFIAHVAKKNPLSALNNELVNLLFSGDNCYLPPAYANNEILPSWLYSSVLVTAKVNIIEGDAKKERVMRQLTTHFEADSSVKWSVDSVPEKHRLMMYQQLSFIEFTPIHWQGNFKLSQNKSDTVREHIKQSLILAKKHTIAALF
jgi:transcriptional regulator